MLVDIKDAQEWLAERFYDENRDDCELADVPLLTLIQRVVEWADEAWYTAGKELERGDRMRGAIEHVVNDLPGTPDSVKRFLSEALREPLAVPVKEGRP